MNEHAPFMMDDIKTRTEIYDNIIYLLEYLHMTDYPNYESRTQPSRRPIRRAVIANHVPKLLHKLLLPCRRRPHSEIPPIVNRRIPPPGMPINHDTASLDEDAPSGGDVPGPGAALPEGVLLAGGDAADCDGGGAGAAQGVYEAAAVMGGAEEGGEDLQVEGKVGALPV